VKYTQAWLNLPTVLKWSIVFFALLFLPLLTTNLYQIRVVNIILINIILCIGLNIVKGFAGQVTVGHIGVYAIGAYASATFSLKFGFPFWICLPLAIITAGLVGIVIGAPSFRLEGAYLALTTLGFGEVIRIFISVTQYFGSTFGISSVPPPQIGEYLLDTPYRYYYLVMPITLLGVYISFAILKSSAGRAFRAVRDDSVSASAAGINVRKYKLVAFIISALYAGCAGSLYAHLTPGYIHPNNFTVIEMVTLLLMVVLGGLGNIWGGIIGAIIITIFYDLTQEYYQYQLLIFGLSIIALVLFMPKGIGGLLQKFFATRKFLQHQKTS
jgi:branched-chain amino acid transport system permease protein